MQHAVIKIHKLLLKKKITVAVAESCTGGLVSSFLTRLPGSSAYFTLGVVAYSNQTKKSLLKIPAQLITRYGAVSAQIALRMAQNIQKLANSDLGIGITGIAGPTGGSSYKPKGTVFIAISSKSYNLCERFIFKGSRSAIRKKAALKSLKLLKEIL